MAKRISIDSDLAASENLWDVLEKTMSGLKPPFILSVIKAKGVPTRHSCGRLFCFNS